MHLEMGAYENKKVIYMNYMFSKEAGPALIKIIWIVLRKIKKTKETIHEICPYNIRKFLIKMWTDYKI